MERSHSELEGLCRRCGQACHAGIALEGKTIMIEDLHCTFLGHEDDGSTFCTVYDTRFEKAPWCHTVDAALVGGLLGSDCPFAQNTPEYQGKEWLYKNTDPRMVQYFEGALRELILKEGIEHWISKEGLLRFLARTGGGNWRVELNSDGNRLLVQSDTIKSDNKEE